MVVESGGSSSIHLRWRRYFWQGKNSWFSKKIWPLEAISFTLHSASPFQTSEKFEMVKYSSEPQLRTCHRHSTDLSNSSKVGLWSNHRLLSNWYIYLSLQASQWTQRRESISTNTALCYQTVNAIIPRSPPFATMSARYKRTKCKGFGDVAKHLMWPNTSSENISDSKSSFLRSLLVKPRSHSQIKYVICDAYAYCCSYKWMCFAGTFKNSLESSIGESKNLVAKCISEQLHTLCRCMKLNRLNA